MSPKTPPKGPTHELFVNRNGTTSLRSVALGEVMHSSVGPREEATLLYIEQSRLANRLKLNATPLVLFDLGLGAATNALAALQCHRTEREAPGADGVRDLHLISFENDLSGLRLAFENREKFPFFEGFDDAVAALLEKHHWSGRGVEWQVREGDFFDCVAVGRLPAPEVIFFDFYSPKVTPHLWDVRTFKTLRALCEPRVAVGGGTTLYTYSASTRVRVALLLAGFYVGYGRSTGAKVDTTVAATRLTDLDRPLDARWLERFRRSHEKFPHGWDVNLADSAEVAAKAAELEMLVLSQPQFK